ncbi:MAG: Ig-like domain-containing protein, partial [Candidatus Rifleibacteriota bacterium]
MNKFLKTSLPLLLLFIIAIAGCNIFPRYGNSKPISTQQPKTVFKTEFSGNNDINFSNSEISLKISKNALDKPQEIKILKYPDSSIIKAPENFDIISCPYQIILDEKILKTPASISFSLKNDYEVETIFALVQSSKESQPRLISPSFLEGKNKFTFSTSIFSTWCMVQRKEKVATAPVSAPFLSVTPLKLMTDNEGYFSHDVVVKTNFSQATSTTSVNSNDYEFTIELLAEQSFQLEFASQNQSKIFTSVLNSTELHSIAVSIFEQDSVDIDLINNLASATARLKTTSYQPSDLPDVILVKSLIKNKDGILYEANLPLNITEEPDPDLTKSFPVLLSSTPQDGENNFPINEPLIFRFNKPINKQSFITAFSISPEIDTSAEYLSWNQESTAVTFTPQSPLEPLTKYKILLSTDLKDNENTFLKQNIEIDFNTAEASAPVLEDFFPSAEQLLALNGSLQLSFNETIASNSFLYVITPQIETEPEFADKYLTISPLDTWPPNTSFEIKLEKGIADLYGNKTEADIIKTFSTSDATAATITRFNPANGYTNAEISTTIEINFSQPMNPNSTIEALDFS